MLPYWNFESFNFRANQILEYLNRQFLKYSNNNPSKFQITDPSTNSSTNNRLPNFPNLKPSNPSPISSNSTVTKSHLTTQTVIQRTNCWRKSIHFLSIPLSPGTSALRTIRVYIYIYIYVSSGVSFQSLNSFTFQATRIFLFRLIRTFHKHNTSDQVSFPIARKTLRPTLHRSTSSSTSFPSFSFHHLPFSFSPLPILFFLPLYNLFLT